MTARLVLAALLGLGLVGCGPLSEDAGTIARWAEPSPTAGPDDVLNALHRAVLDDADMTASGFGGGGWTMVTGEMSGVDADPWRPCEADLASDPDRRHALGREFRSKTSQVLHRTFGYWDVDAADALAEIEDAARECDSYRATTGDGPAEYRVHAPVTLPDLPGVERAYGYCETGRDGEYVWAFCYVAMARGKVLSMARVNQAEELPARDMMLALAPRAAELLVAATEPE